MPEPAVIGAAGNTLLDAGLPLLNLATSPAKLTEFLNTHLIRRLDHVSGPITAEILDVSYRPQRRCIILCALRSVDQGTGSPHMATVSLAAGDWIAAVHRDHYAGQSDTRAIHLPDHGVLIELFPVDWALPTLEAALSPGALEPFFPPTGLDLEQKSAGRPARTEILHYRPHRRAVIAYATAERDRLAVAKIYRSASEAQQAWESLRLSHSWLEQRGCRVPEPLKLVPELRLFSMKYMDGVPLNRVLSSRDHNHSDAVVGTRLAAEALAAFHAQPATGAPTRDLFTELAALKKRVDVVRSVSPDLASRIRPLLDEINDRASRCRPARACRIHGDFTPSQLLVREDDIAMLDFDLSVSGDPALDVANFLAKLGRRARRTGDDWYRELADTFLSRYVRQSHADSGLVDRIHVLGSLALVRTAVRSFRHMPVIPSETSEPHQFLDEAELALSRQGPPC